MAGGGARRGTLVIHCVAGHRRPLLDRGSPETGQGPAVANPRIRVWSTVVLSCRPLPCATAERSFASEPIGRRTLVPAPLETGQDSGPSLTADTHPPHARCRISGRARPGVGAYRRIPQPPSCPVSCGLVS